MNRPALDRDYPAWMKAAAFARGKSDFPRTRDSEDTMSKSVRFAIVAVVAVVGAGLWASGNMRSSAAAPQEPNTVSIDPLMMTFAAYNLPASPYEFEPF
jgi:hypothetical protein